jgi:hypothetical protein
LRESLTRDTHHSRFISGAFTGWPAQRAREILSFTNFFKESVTMEASNYPTEDRVTASIEQRTAKIPSTTYLGLAIGSMAASAILQMMGKRHWALFIGQWAAPFLIMGNYNKMVKQHGSDARSRFDTAA